MAKGQQIGTRGKGPKSKQADKKDKELDIPHCLECNLAIKDSTKALNCDKCGAGKAWKCIDCIDIPDSTYDVLITDGGKSIFWFCDACQENAIKPNVDDKVLGLLEKLTEQIDKIERKLDLKADVERVEALKGRVKQLEEKMEGWSTEAPTAKASIDKPDLTATQLRQAADEVAEIEKRRVNLIISGLPENADDTVDFLEYCNSYHSFPHQLSNNDLSQVVRLGKPTNNAIPRMLRITFHSQEVRRSVLTMHSRRLSRPDTPIYVRPDLTTSQMQHDKKLREELTAKGRDKYKISRGRIVPRDPDSARISSLDNRDLHSAIPLA
jgi:hypothetical protein